ncbi:response regulator [Psychrobium sp. 1_MG-2023]|uniref:response regulator n=1 Tax=Psychrobium sp. 1_MG-2023 TaxID=3062624 RepID=UPI000C32811D|nr:response regulator [Psychrobium sp. 1_MG-2023]MDP2562474.1 response regulator [Psychrobium sp. 1_MG-2023]PKF54308.1 hypothetical protein CW748_16390 [Alteromonadales bacterium alter-6D02]
MSAVIKIPYPKLQVLLVDPQRPFQIMMKGILSNFGVRKVDFADNGEAAVRACRAKEYHLLLVEYNLGSNKNGRQLLEELRTLRLIKPDTLFVIVSAETDRAAVLGTMEMAPDDYIIKPFSQRLLDNRLQKAWSKRLSLSAIHHCSDKKDFPRAIATCKSLIKEKNRYSALILQMMTDFMCREERYEEATEILASILKERELIWANITLARAYLGLSKLEHAEARLKAVLKQQVNNVDAMDLLAQVQLANKQAETAEKTLTKSLEISPYSMSRHQLMVDVATANHNHALVKDSYGQLLQLSRRSVHTGTDHLFNYTRSIINQVAHSEEPNAIYKLQNELTSTLHRAKLEEGRQLKYHFSALEGVIISQLQSAKGETLLSKKTLMEAIHGFCDEDDEWSLPDELAPDTCITLLNLSDFELASKFAEQLDDTNDITNQIQARLNDDEVVEKKAEFNKITRQGIDAYSAGNNLEALELFKQAIFISPVNSGAVLNVAQAQIKLMQEKKKYVKSLMGECKESFRVLNGMKLSKAHQKRFVKLRTDFNQLQKK